MRSLLIFFVFAMCLPVALQSKTPVPDDKETAANKILSFALQAACHCVDSVSKTNTTGDALAAAANDCLHRNMNFYQMAAGLMYAASKKNDSTPVEVFINDDTAFIGYKEVLQDFKFDLADSCAAANKLFEDKVWTE